LFKRTRYQHGSIEREERKKGPAVWLYRWWEPDIAGKRVHRKLLIGDVETYPSESAALAAADALRLTINNHSRRKSLQRITINTLWEHYCREEMPLKEMSTQDAYTTYAKNWILPRWDKTQLEEVKTVEVERWLRATEVADGTKAKMKCVMSALFSHAVRWELCGHNPISSGSRVGCGGKRGPSTGVRISAKRRNPPLVLSPEQVKLGLEGLEFRDQLLVFLDGALGARRGELGAPLARLRFSRADTQRKTLVLLAPWRAFESHQDRGVGKTAANARRLERCVARVEIAEPLHTARGFRLRVFSLQRTEAARSCRCSETEDSAGFRQTRHYGVGWHTFRHTVGTMLAEMGEHQLTIRDYLRHSNLHVTNKYLQATPNSKRLAQDKLVDAILPAGVLRGKRSTLIQ
jgi:integrase